MLFGYGRTAVGAAIIDENDLDITIGLVENTANGALERALGVVEGQYDADLFGSLLLPKPREELAQQRGAFAFEDA